MPIRPQQGGVPNVARSLPIVRNFLSNFSGDGINEDRSTVLRSPVLSNQSNRSYLASLTSTLLGTAAVLLTVTTAPTPFAQDDWPIVRNQTRSHGQIGSVSSNVFLYGDQPFAQDDWPIIRNKTRSYGQAGTVSSNSFLYVDSVIAAPFNQSDWKTPQRKSPVSDQLGSVSSAALLLSIDTTPVRQAVVTQYYRSKVFVGDQLYSVNLSLLGTPVLSPFGQSDWSNPRGRTPTQIGFVKSSDWLASPFAQNIWPITNRPKVISDQFGFVASSSWLAAPFSQVDWQNPVRAKYSPTGHIDTYKIGLYQVSFATPFLQSDWPDPNRAARPLIGDQLGYIDPSETWLLKDTFFGPAGMGPTYDWPNPQRVKQRNEFGSTDTYKVTLFTFIPPPTPFALNDWPNPRGSRPMTGDQLGYLDSTEFWLLNHVFPTVSQFDWSNPVRAKTSPVPYSGHFDTYKIGLFQVTFAPPFVQSDWPNPQRSKAVNNLDRSTPYNINLLVTFTAIPFVQSDWPNPQRSRAVNNLDRSTLYNINLFITFAPFAQVDWPVPKIRLTNQFGFVESYKINLRQVPFAQTGWPNPAGAIRNVVHYGHFDFYKINLLNPLNRPAKQVDWPNPNLGPRRNIGNYGWSARQQLIPGNFQVPGAGQLILTTYAPMLTLESSHHWRQIISLRGDVVIRDSLLGSTDNKPQLKGNRIIKTSVAGEIDNEEDLLGNIDNKRDIEGG